MPVLWLSRCQRLTQKFMQCYEERHTLTMPYIHYIFFLFCMHCYPRVCTHPASLLLSATITRPQFGRIAYILPLRGTEIEQIAFRALTLTNNLYVFPKKCRIIVKQSTANRRGGRREREREKKTNWKTHRGKKRTYRTPLGWAG